MPRRRRRAERKPGKERIRGRRRHPPRERKRSVRQRRAKKVHGARLSPRGTGAKDQPKEAAAAATTEGRGAVAAATTAPKLGLFQSLARSFVASVADDRLFASAVRSQKDCVLWKEIWERRLSLVALAVLRSGGSLAVAAATTEEYNGARKAAATTARGRARPRRKPRLQ